MFKIHRGSNIRSVIAFKLGLIGFRLFSESKLKEINGKIGKSKIVLSNCICWYSSIPKAKGP